MKTAIVETAVVLLIVLAGTTSFAQQSTPTPNAPSKSPQAAVDEWADDFDGDRLDETKWELYTFVGGRSSKVEVKDKQLKMRGARLTLS